MNIFKIFTLITLFVILICFKKCKIEHFNNDLYWDEVYLLNIPRLKKRKNYMLNEFKKHNLNSKIHYGVDKNHIDATFLEKLKNDGKITQKYLNESLDKKKGTLACLLTHVGLWEKLKKSNKNHFLIFEDDCHLVPDFNEKARKYLKYVPSDWDMIWLGHGRLKGKKINKYVLVPENNPGFGLNALHHCYMIKKSSIDKFLNFLYPLNVRNSKDNIIRKNFDKFNAYFIIDSLANQDRKVFSVSEREK